MWMVRAEGGALLARFAAGVAAVGWERVGNLSKATTRDAVRALYEAAYPEDSPGKAANAIGVLYKFRAVLAPSHKVITYDPDNRRYLVGDITSDYLFSPTEVGAQYPHLRRVAWSGSINRDDLSPATRSTLGSTLALFAIHDDAAAELLAVLRGGSATSEDPKAVIREELSTLKEDESAKSIELIKDAIVALSDRDVEQLVASILRAMGYRARVTPVGPDRGVDVIASPDGLGLEEPRIKAEVKHRPKTSMGAPELRSFIGGLRQGDRGLYVSTGGFTKEARYEAERSTVPLTLIDLDDFASLVTTHYEDFDVEGRVVLPLVRVYLPAE
ncbi:MAG TPA: restriction endonuclease [Pirellulaceae bacterium]|nr:restriction endonuclease [Pirellulaceae bacterium]